MFGDKSAVDPGVAALDAGRYQSGRYMMFPTELYGIAAPDVQKRQGFFVEHGQGRSSKRHAQDGGQWRRMRA
jgi:hypothetical protein